MNQSINCRVCGAGIVRKPGPGRKPKYCSHECRRAQYRSDARIAYREKIEAGGRTLVGTGVCIGCGGTCQKFNHGVRVRYCSKPDCVREANRVRSKEAYVPTAHTLVCAFCEAPFQGRNKKRKYCAQSCANRAFNARRRADGRAAEMSAKRRAMERGAKIKDGRRVAVLARDNWICHLCELPTNRGAVYPAPDYPVIDHVVPLSKGGAHSEDNWKTAHNRCNSVRRDLTVEEFRLLS